MSFDHRDPGTPEAAWAQAGVLDLPPADPEPLARAELVLFLAAHPDDEALGCAALLKRCAAAGQSATLLLFSAGERSHPGSPTHSETSLKTVRLDEFGAASRYLGHVAESYYAGYADGTLRDREHDIRRDILDAINAVEGPVAIVAPYSEDGHPDHEAVGRAALAVGRQCNALVMEYPIWYWHWATPDDGRWRTWHTLADPADLDRAHLWGLYPSQTRDLSDAPGDEAIVSASHLAHFERGGDTYAITSFAAGDATTAGDVFDRVHTADTDPWSVQDSAYELAKRATLLTHLPQRTYDHCLEIGCSIGATTIELARVSKRVTAVDASRAALATAARLHPPSDTVRYVHASVPLDWPPGRFDLVVLAETGYYLSLPQLHRVLERIAATASAPFTLALCHWKGEIQQWPLSADEVHDYCLGFWPRSRSEFQADGEYRMDIVTINDPADTSAIVPSDD